jgi:hypothetical protein
MMMMMMIIIIIIIIISSSIPELPLSHTIHPGCPSARSVLSPTNITTDFPLSLIFSLAVTLIIKTEWVRRVFTFLSASGTTSRPLFYYRFSALINAFCSAIRTSASTLCRRALTKRCATRECTTSFAREFNIAAQKARLNSA